LNRQDAKTAKKVNKNNLTSEISGAPHALPLRGTVAPGPSALD